MQNRDLIPEEDREECYYFDGIKDDSLKEVFVAGVFDDGTHGELPVCYARKGVLSTNRTIEKLFLAESITDLRGSLLWGAINVETVVMPGITNLIHLDKEIYGTNNFNDCFNLTKLVVGAGYRNNARNFFAQGQAPIPQNFVGKADILVCGNVTDPKNASILLQNSSWADYAEILTLEKYFQDATGVACDAWSFSEDGESVEVRKHLYKNGYCKYCQAQDPKGITYVWDETTESYHISSGVYYEEEFLEIPETYDDGVHGEAAITAVSGSAFSGNKNIKYLILPESVTTIGGNAFMATNIEYLSMAGVTGFVSGTINHFLNSLKLSTVIIGEQFYNNANQSFVHNQKTEHIPVLDFYVLGDANKPHWWCKNGKTHEKLLTGNLYSYDATGKVCGTWSYDDKGYGVVMSKNSEHDYDDNGVCKNCGTYDAYGIIYSYDETTESYYVANNSSYTETTFVEIRSEYNDGVHGEAPVTYVATGAFSGNKTITHLILPESVTTIGGNAFMATNIEYLSMTGVTGFVSGTINHFLNSLKLSTVIIGEQFYNNANQSFVHNQSSHTAILDLYVFGDASKPHWWCKNGKTHEKLLTGNVYSYDESGKACGTWSYATDGYTIVKVADHHFVDGACSVCDYVDNLGVTYAYDKTNGVYYVADNKTYADSTVTVLERYNDNVNGWANVTYVADYAFSTNSSIETVILPESITLLGYQAFANAKNLKYVSMTGVTLLGEKARFAGYEGMTKANASGGVQVFNGCTSLQTVIVGSSLTIKTDRCFYATPAPETKAQVYMSTSDTTATVNIPAGDNNILSTNVAWYSETSPTDTENVYWHYVDGVATLWNE